MGTFLPVLGTIGSTIGTIQTIGKAFNTLSGDTLQSRQRELAMSDLQRQQAQETAEANAKASLQKQQITLDAADTERRRLAALKRAVAKRNASFGASGIGGNSGSRDAILLGLYNESDAEKQQSEALDKIRFDSISNDLSNIASRNILEKTQLSERQKLESIADSF